MKKRGAMPVAVTVLISRIIGKRRQIGELTLYLKEIEEIYETIRQAQNPNRAGPDLRVSSQNRSDGPVGRTGWAACTQ